MVVKTLKTKKTGRINTGIATNDLIYTSYTEDNSAVFPKILEIYAKVNDKIADITYGKGVFWKEVNIGKYEVFFSDIKKTILKDDLFLKTFLSGVDCRKLPYIDESFDIVVFDPPYMHTPGGTAHNGHQNFEEYYANNNDQNLEIIQQISNNGVENIPKYHEAVLDLYNKTALEAKRVLKSKGIFIVKCQDEVCANKQRLTHIEITNSFDKLGFLAEDLFVVIRKNKPGISRLKSKQMHARKNHSYFMVYRKL
jgi:hypothetical protein